MLTLTHKVMNYKSPAYPYDLLEFQIIDYFQTQGVITYSNQNIVIIRCLIL